MYKFDFGWGSAPDLAGGAYSAPPDPIAGFKGPPRNAILTPPSQKVFPVHTESSKLWSNQTV